MAYVPNWVLCGCYTNTDDKQLLQLLNSFLLSSQGSHTMAYCQKEIKPRRQNGVEFWGNCSSNCRSTASRTVWQATAKFRWTRLLIGVGSSCAVCSQLGWMDFGSRSCLLNVQAWRKSIALWMPLRRLMMCTTGPFLNRFRRMKTDVLLSEGLPVWLLMSCLNNAGEISTVS